MRVLLDTSAVIYLSGFSGFDEILTVNSVLNEIKDRASRMKLAGISLKIVEPSRESLRKVEDAARETGDLENLSKTDLEVLAAADENKCAIISDDRGIQNVAEKIGIPYVSVFNKKISKMITWGKYCTACKRYSKGERCQVCGGELKRIPKEQVKAKN
jgi:UPF0271 protein